MTSKTKQLGTLHSGGAGKPSKSRSVKAGPKVLVTNKIEAAKPKIPTQAPKPSLLPFEFSIEESDAYQIRGWLRNPSEPQQRYEVQAWSDGVLVGYDIAKRERTINPGKESEGTGFEIRLSHWVRDTRPHRIRLVIPGKTLSEEPIELAVEISVVSAAVDGIDPNFDLLTPHEDELWAKDALSSGMTEQVRYVFERVTPKVSLHLHNRDFPESKTLIEFALKATNKHEFFAFKGAEFLMLQGSYEKASSLFKTILKGNLNLIPAYYGLGVALMRMGQLDAATRVLERALTLDSDNRRINSAIRTLKVERVLEPGSQVTQAELKTLIDDYYDALSRSDDKQYNQETLMRLLEKSDDLSSPDREGFEVRSSELKSLKRARLLLQYCLAVTPKIVTGQ